MCGDLFLKFLLHDDSEFSVGTQSIYKLSAVQHICFLCDLRKSHKIGNRMQ